MQHQKDLFSLDASVHYLNSAAYSPLLQSSVAAAQDGLMLKASRPHTIRPTDHFDGAERVRALFAQLVGSSEPDRVAIIPAASYGLAIVAANLHRLPDIQTRNKYILVGDEFPNGVYAFERVGQTLGLHPQILSKPDATESVADVWTAQILEQITRETALVLCPPVHWSNGVRFDLEAIGATCREKGALFIVDGAQSVGALPIDVHAIQADALIAPAYKWLLGPYSLGCIWLSDFFDDGVPVEESWMNRMESDQFSNLTRYIRDYRPKAQRYNMGEFSAFATLPAFEAALQQLLNWTPQAIQDYSRNLAEPYLEKLNERGFYSIPPSQRASHLVQLMLPKHLTIPEAQERLKNQQVYVSVRGSGFRVSTHIYNTTKDWDALVDALG